MDFKEKAFEFVFEAMASAGGDGDAILCCDDWQKAAAEDFEKWLSKNHPHCLKRENHTNYILFFSDQESITIAHFDYDTSPKTWTEGYVRTLLF